MNYVKPSFEILTPISDGGETELRNIESIARVCYKSEPKSDSFEDTKKFIGSLVKRGHLAMLEHSTLAVKFTTDRCVTHEIVRHRMAAFAQESTRWCNYAKDKFGAEITLIEPDFSKAKDPYSAKVHFDMVVKTAEHCYLYLVNEQGLTPQIARRVLPHCLKAEIVVTANYREWMHILELRTAPDCDPEMRELMSALLKTLRQRIPVIFDMVGMRGA